jgi:phenylalanine ammonia-lyase
MTTAIDLAPLSYIAGALRGNPRIRVFDGPYPVNREKGEIDGGFARRTVPCTIAYQEHGMNHFSFEAKEYLGALNGTAFSASVASLALMDALQAGMLAQICTAMGTEGLLGTQGLPKLFTFPFHPLF